MPGTTVGVLRVYYDTAMCLWAVDRVIENDEKGLDWQGLFRLFAEHGGVALLKALNPTLTSEGLVEPGSGARVQQYRALTRWFDEALLKLFLTGVVARNAQIPLQKSEVAAMTTRMGLDVVERIDQELREIAPKIPDLDQPGSARTQH